MSFLSPLTVYTKQSLSMKSICDYDGNWHTIEVSADDPIVSIAKKPYMGDSVLISYCGRTDFVTVQGKALITQDRDAIKGYSLGGMETMGVVTSLLNRIEESDS
ncbi:TPA: hypothetical protein JHK03_003600 [Enterobacter cloacae]|uniref:hypothetical protein n=1 Tax=Enterobacter sp. MGH 38 TaxID=1329834 RepID=UPI00287BFA3D|nr:hypothetical protein [Enterobacter hormaechei subsp. steigerwaltii]HAV2152987.1 hypothetical protein [Enterobacter cloacae]HCR2012817.1 hypothetical protein [Enterobacter asburiae]HCR2222326.1 hypothetical protein [Enterobacter asburiae]HDX3905062.1 hypothetical protein [Enterobacter asburiae]